MAKEKKAILEQERKDLTFYYEIVGIITILITTIALARLGSVGRYLMISFRILFGDWYFAFLFALLLYGLRSLLIHKPLNLKNMRAIGIMLLMMGILILSHFPMHNYIKGFGTSYLSMTMQLYLDYFKNYHDGMIVGGGIIGCCFFYLFYMMFSSVGTVIITLIIIFVGIAFTSRKTVAEFIMMVANIFIGLFKKTNKVVRTLKYDIDTSHKPKTKSKKAKSITLDMLKTNTQIDYSVMEEKHAEGMKRTIANALNNMNIFYNEITYIISYHVTSYIINTIAAINLEALNLKLKKVINSDFLIKQKVKTNKIVVEIENIQKRQIDLKTILSQHRKVLENHDYLFGVNSFNEPVKINFSKQSNFFLLGNKATNNFLDSIIITTLIKKVNIPINLTILDLNNQLNHWQSHPSYRVDQEHLDDIKQEMDKRLDELHLYALNSWEEYNNSLHVKVPFSQEIIIITGFGNLVYKERAKETLMYLLQIGKQCGYAFLCVSNTDSDIPTMISSLLENKLIFNSGFVLATRILSFNGAPVLDEEGEMFYVQKDEVERISIVQTPFENIDFFVNKKS